VIAREKRERATHMADRLIELYVRHDRARTAADWRQAERLQAEIDTAAAARRQLMAQGADD
jgi:molybdenum-dependent DNA-binding transcriptional regulator ModE